ncbi:MAG: ATP-binding domain-containing protein [Candidatus Competibacteraceae bacterium]|nr:ATP-binding domain-containing protein [Candidatus Competibacteraceae bacterium]
MNIVASITGAFGRSQALPRTATWNSTTAWSSPTVSPHIAHGYATTSYAAQGKTVKHVFIAESSESFRAANREQFYVAVSRACEAVHIVTDNKKWLFEVVQNSSQRLAALDITKPKKNPPARPLDHDEEIRQAQKRAEAVQPNDSPCKSKPCLGWCHRHRQSPEQGRGGCSWARAGIAQVGGRYRECFGGK